MSAVGSSDSPPDGRPSSPRSIVVGGGGVVPAGAPPAAASAAEVSRARWTSLDERCSSRADRTARVTLPVEGKPYDRQAFVDRVAATAGLATIEAIGPTNLGHVWTISFDSLSAKTTFVEAGDFDIGSCRAVVAGSRPRRTTMRLHWIPYDVPMPCVVDVIRKLPGIKVIQANYETASVRPRSSAGAKHTIRTLVRVVVVEAASAAAVPHVITWRNAAASGQALVTVRGRAGACLRCLSTAHFRKNCDAVKCGNCHKWGRHQTAECPVSPSYATRTAPDVADTEGDLVEEDADAPMDAAVLRADVTSAVDAAAGRPTAVRPLEAAGGAPPHAADEEGMSTDEAPLTAGHSAPPPTRAVAAAAKPAAHVSMVGGGAAAVSAAAAVKPAAAGRRVNSSPKSKADGPAVAAAGTGEAGALLPPHPPRQPAAHAPPHEDVETGRAPTFDAGPAGRPPGARPPSGSAAAAAAADAGGVDTSLAAAQLTAEKAVRDVLTSDDGSDSDSESDVFDDCASPWTENDDVDVVDRTITPAGDADHASPPSSPADHAASSAETLTDRTDGDRPPPAHASTPVLKRSHSALSLASAVSASSPAIEKPQMKKKRRKRRGRDATPPGPAER